MEKYINKGSGVALENTNYVSKLKNIIIEDDNVFFVVSTSSGDDRVLLFNDTSFIIIDDVSGDELSSNNINSELAKNFMNDIATLIIRDLGNIRDIKESIKILLEDNKDEEDEEDNKFLFRDEKLEFEFIILLGDKNISIFNPENGKEIITSEYNLDMARIAMMNIFLSSFHPGMSHIFFDYPYRDFATPIFSAIDYNLIMDDFITYFYKLEGFISEYNIRDLIGPFVKSGWVGAVKFILNNTSDKILKSSGYSIITYIAHRFVHSIISDMVKSNNQEMFDFIFDEFMPKYGYDNETNYIDLATLIITDGTVEQFEYLVHKLPIEIDLARKENVYGTTLFFEAIMHDKIDIVKYMILNYNVDPNEKIVDIYIGIDSDDNEEEEEKEQQHPIEKSYINLSLKHNNNIEIFKLLISKDDLVLSEEDRELIEKKAESNEEIRAAYEEYLERNGFEIVINDFGPDEGHFTSI